MPKVTLDLTDDEHAVVSVLAKTHGRALRREAAVLMMESAKQHMHAIQKALADAPRPAAKKTAKRR